jgi:hypothetical protein
MGLNSADRGDTNPAMVGVGVGHHPLGPVEQHQAGTPFGLDQPLPPGRLSGYLRDQRTEILLVGGQLHQEPPHLVHIQNVGGTQLVQLSQEMAEWAGGIASAHSPNPKPTVRQRPSACAPPGRPEYDVAFDGHAVGLFDGAQAGGYPGLAGRDGLAVTLAVGTYGQALAEAFCYTNMGLTFVGVRRDSEDQLDRLRDLLRQHGIEPDGGTARTA